MGRCKPTRSNPSGRCGMSMGIYNPFFQNGAPFYGSGESAPTVQASEIVVTVNNDGTATISWTNGGGANRIVVMRSVIPVNANPSNGTTYTANAAYGSGDQVGVGNYVVYNGSGNSVNVTGLTIGALYYVRVYERNGTTYLTDTASNNPNSFTEEAGPLGDTGLKFFFDPSNTMSMWQQQNGTVAQIDYSDTNDDVVGTVDDLSPNTAYFGPASDARRPLLKSDATRNSFLRFDGTDDNMSYATLSAFNFIHKANAVFTIAVWVKKNLDGTLQQIAGNNDAGTARIGHTLRLTAADKILFSIQYASAGNNVINFTSSYTLNAAAGWKLVIITSSGSGTGTCILNVVDAAGIVATESFNVAATGTTSNASNSWFIGSTFTPSVYLNADLGHIWYYDRVISADEITTLRAYNPARRAVNYRRLAWYIDMGDQSTVFSDLAGATPITDEGEIQRVNSKTDASLGRYWNYATVAGEATAGKPLWKEAEVNGLSTGEWNGDVVDEVYDNLAFSQKPKRGGARIEYFIVKNRRAGSGSHVMSNGPGYPVITGSDYPENDNQNNGNEYWTTHAGGSTSVVGAKNFPEAFNIIANRRNGAILGSMNEDGDYAEVTDQSTSEVTDWTNIGFSWKVGVLGPPWHADMFFPVYQSYNGYATTQEVEDMIGLLKAAHPYHTGW